MAHCETDRPRQGAKKSNVAQKAQMSCRNERGTGRWVGEKRKKKYVYMYLCIKGVNIRLLETKFKKKDDAIIVIYIYYSYILNCKFMFYPWRFPLLLFVHFIPYPWFRFIRSLRRHNENFICMNAFYYLTEWGQHRCSNRNLFFFSHFFFFFFCCCFCFSSSYHPFKMYLMLNVSHNRFLALCRGTHKSNWAEQKNILLNSKN